MKPAEAFKVFNDEIERLSDKLGFKDWDIRVALEPMTSGVADCNADYINRLVTIRMNKKHKFTCRDEVLQVAKHEVGHILTAELVYLCKERYITPMQLSRAEEAFSTLCEKIL